jgi:hypothetical protein
LERTVAMIAWPTGSVPMRELIEFGISIAYRLQVLWMKGLFCVDCVNVIFFSRFFRDPGKSAACLTAGRSVHHRKLTGHQSLAFAPGSVQTWTSWNAFRAKSASSTLTAQEVPSAASLAVVRSACKHKVN